jgi:hypothetical protein
MLVLYGIFVVEEVKKSETDSARLCTLQTADRHYLYTLLLKYPKICTNLNYDNRMYLCFAAFGT